MIAVVLACLAPWCAVGFCCRLLYRMLTQQGTLLERLKIIEQQQVQIRGLIQRRRQADNLARFALEQQMQAAAPKPPSGLPIGNPAPDFDLPDLAGKRHKLEEYRGRKLLLVFFNPGCGYCTQMAPEIAQLPTDGQIIPVLITAGSAEANGKLVQEHKLRCPMLLDEKGEVGLRYQMSGTPTGYLIDEKGAIASPLMIGSRELLSLRETDEAKDDHAPTKGKENKGLAASRITRDGLKAGTLAPNFRLPKVGGGEVALEDLRGKQVILVLSDPECGPCNALAPKLEELHRQRPDVHFLMISRRDEDANKKKIAEHGLTFPVVLQKQWEISRLYGIFSTPVAYSIDANGVIEYDVAVGADAIPKLLVREKSLAA